MARHKHKLYVVGLKTSRVMKPALICNSTAILSIDCHVALFTHHSKLVFAIASRLDPETSFTNM